MDQETIDRMERLVRGIAAGNVIGSGQIGDDGSGDLPDPDVVVARQIIADLCEREGISADAEDYRLGMMDKSYIMRATLAALKHGRAE